MKTGKIKRGDKVKVIAGKDKGREGVVEKIFPKKGKLIVAGVNLYKKHARATKGRQGGIIDVTRPLMMAKVRLICPKCGQPTRVGLRLKPEKARVCKKCREAL